MSRSKKKTITIRDLEAARARVAKIYLLPGFPPMGFDQYLNALLDAPCAPEEFERLLGDIERNPSEFYTLTGRHEVSRGRP